MPRRPEPARSTSAAALARGAAIMSVFLAAFVAVYAAGDPRQPVRTAVLALAAGTLLAARSSRRASGRSVRAWKTLVGAFLGLLTLSALVNGPASAVWGVHGRMDGLVAWAVLALTGAAGLASSDSYARLLPRLSAAAIAPQAAVVMLQAARGLPAVGSTGNQVITGGWLAVCVALSSAGALVERGARRAIVSAAAVLGAVALGVVGSRGAWVGLAVALGLLLAVRARTDRLAVWGSAVLVLALLGGAVLAGGEPVEKLSAARISQGSAAARLEIWRGTVALISGQPLLGAGPGRFLYAFPRYESVEHARVEGPDVRADQAHSRPLHVAAEAGVPAALAWFGLFGVALNAGVRGVRRRSPHALVLATGLVAYLGQALFSVHAVEVDGLGWLLAGMLVGSGSADEDVRVRDQARFAASRWAAGGVAATIACACAWHLVADVQYRRSVSAFERGDVRTALEHASRAVWMDPLTDVYRVAYADAASYLGTEERDAASAIIQAGLRLEPESYDLALSRARLLRLDRLPGAADAYLAAAALYPRGVAVRREALKACIEDGRIDDARRLATELLEVVPEDPDASALVRSGR